MILKKKWIVILKIDVGALSPGEIPDYMEGVKKTLPQKEFDDFFETKTFVLYIPIRDRETSIEIHEIILNDLGYDKYERILQDNSLTIRNVLDNIKELLDGSDKE